MKKNILMLIILSSTILQGCSSENDFEKGKSQLENMGYTDIENTGHKFFCCGDDDDYSTGFKAKNKKGETVTGCFCSSLGKGVTVRIK